MAVAGHPWKRSIWVIGAISGEDNYTDILRKKLLALILGAWIWTILALGI
jgi:hypothetical protein